MPGKPTYEELKKRVAELENAVVTYDEAKATLRESLDRQEDAELDTPEIETAVEVFDQDADAVTPVEEAFIAEHIFRKAIEDAVPAGIIAFDLEGRQIYVNTVFADMVDWGVDQLVGAKAPFAYWPQEIYPRYPQPYNIMLRDDIPPEGLEIQFCRRDRSRFWVLIVGAPLADSQGQSIGRIFSVADISGQKRAEKALRTLSAKLLDAQENERKAISQDLHDRIGAQLTGIKYGLETLVTPGRENQPYPRELLHNMIRVVKKTIEETQRISRNLHPSVLDDLGVLAALRDLVREYNLFFPAITTDVNLTIDEADIDLPLKTVIYRVVQEAMNNVAKHSAAKRLQVRLGRQDQQIVLEIEDNGSGFETARTRAKTSVSQGIGLESMRERTELFEGSFEIHSTHGRGTCVRATWPE